MYLLIQVILVVDFDEWLGCSILRCITARPVTTRAPAKRDANGTVRHSLMGNSWNSPERCTPYGRERQIFGEDRILSTTEVIFPCNDGISSLSKTRWMSFRLCWNVFTWNDALSVVTEKWFIGLPLMGHSEFMIPSSSDNVSRIYFRVHTTF